MSQVFECVACLHQTVSRLQPLVCDRCGRTETFAIAERASNDSKAVSALEVSLGELERVPTGDESLDNVLLGGFVRPCTLTAFGVAGVGKSRSALRWATRIGTTLLVSLEMPTPLAVLSAREARADLKNLFIVEHEDWQIEAARVKAKVVVFDSYQYSQKQRVIRGSKVPLVCHEISEWAKQNQGIGILIAHQNKKGRVSGTTAAEHWPDYLFKLEKHGNSEAKVIISKARYSPSGSAIVTI
jgi:predicted ATP-dependent serine protease